MEDRRWQAAIFDFDGVLVNSGDAYRTALTEHVGVISSEEWPRVYGMTTREAIQYASPSELTSGEVNDIGHQIDLSVGEILARLRPEREGALDLLQALRKQDVRLAIASSASHLAIDATLESLGWSDMFELVVAREDAPRAKPYPDLYARAVAQLRVPVSACWAVEDTDIGIRAAQQAGLFTVALGGTQSQEALRGADLWFADFQSFHSSSWFANGLAGAPA